MIMAAKQGCFHNYRNILFSGKPILRFCAASFVFTFAVLSSVAAVVACFRHRDKKRLYLSRIHSPYSTRGPFGQAIFKQIFSLDSVALIV